MKKKNAIEYSMFVQTNNGHKYWHEDFLLFKNDEKTLYEEHNMVKVTRHEFYNENITWNETATLRIWFSSIFNILQK